MLMFAARKLSTSCSDVKSAIQNKLAYLFLLHQFGRILKGV
jgi:hypothetical protein